MTENTLHLKELVEKALNQHESIRGIGIVEVNGTQVYFKLRGGLTPLLTDVENQEYASHAIDRHKNRIRFDGKTGGLEYGVVKYEKVIRGIIPITDQFYLLMAFVYYAHFLKLFAHIYSAIRLIMVKMSESNSPRKIIKGEEKVAANSLKTLVYTIAMSVDDKVVLEDMINKLSQEADTMLDIINDISNGHQKELLLGYKTLLNSCIDAVNRRLANL